MSDWQTIDTAPLDGTRLLLCDDLDRYPYTGKFMEDWGDNGMFAEDGAGVVSTPNQQPTHWASLPAAPTPCDPTADDRG